MSETLTRSLGHSSRSCGCRDSSEALSVVQPLADVGTMIAGSVEDPRRSCAALRPAGDDTLPGGPRGRPRRRRGSTARRPRARLRRVALRGHPARAVAASWPRASPQGERRQMATAYVAGYEYGRLQRRDPPAHEKGWHPTASSAHRAAAACARCAARCRQATTAMRSAPRRAPACLQLRHHDQAFHAGRRRMRRHRCAPAAPASRPRRRAGAPAGLLAATSPKGNVDRGAQPAGRDLASSARASA